MVQSSGWCHPWWLSFLDRVRVLQIHNTLSNMPIHSVQINLIVTGLTAAVIILTRSTAVIYFALGALICTSIVKVMKKAIRQPRPANQTSKQKTTYGYEGFSTIVSLMSLQ